MRYMYRILANMLTIRALMKLVEVYCQSTGLAEATVSSRLFNDGKRIAEVRGGADMGVRRIERSIEWLSENWPDGVDWPDGVPRPQARAREAAE